MNLAIIPARSGSKGVVNKNIRNLNGKPLIAYTIEAAIKSKLFETVMVSTDSKEYAKIAELYGAEVPFLRSKEKASDTATSWDVVKEVISEYKNLNSHFKNVALLQPTSPLRTSDDIKDSYNILVQDSVDMVVSVCETEHSPLLSNVLPENNIMDKFLENRVAKLPRQLIQKYYRLNGAIYFCDIEFLLKSSNLYGKTTIASIMSQENSIDIDTELDFMFAETVMNYNEGRIYESNKKSF